MPESESVIIIQILSRIPFYLRLFWINHTGLQQGEGRLDAQTVGLKYPQEISRICFAKDKWNIKVTHVEYKTYL